MPLLDFRQVRPWTKSIRKEIESRAMPPWHADPAHGKFKNDRRLAEGEVQRILSWIDSGAPEGDPADLPPPNRFAEGWRIGEPDIVFELPQAQDVPAEGVMPYKYFTVKTNFAEDRWIERAEARPDAREVVHHIIVFMLPDEGSLFRSGNPFDNYLAGVAPGEEPLIFPPGHGRRIPKGATLLFQMHYTPNGKAVRDRSRVGLVFARSPVRHEVRTRSIINQGFEIPAGAAAHVVERRSRRFSEPRTVVSFMPHMHLRGKSFEYRLVAPNGEETVLLSVPKYDFNWQNYYVLAEPLVVPEGSAIRCIATYDNSSANPANPDPSKSVRWGDQTWEEMMIGFYDTIHPLKSPALDPAAKPGASRKGGAPAEGKAERF